MRIIYTRKNLFRTILTGFKELSRCFVDEELPFVYRVSLWVMVAFGVTLWILLTVMFWKLPLLPHASSLPWLVVSLLLAHFIPTTCLSGVHRSSRRQPVTASTFTSREGGSSVPYEEREPSKHPRNIDEVISHFVTHFILMSAGLLLTTLISIIVDVTVYDGMIFSLGIFTHLFILGSALLEGGVLLTFISTSSIYWELHHEEDVKKQKHLLLPLTSHDHSLDNSLSRKPWLTIVVALGIQFIVFHQLFLVTILGNPDVVLITRTFRMDGITLALPLREIRVYGMVGTGVILLVLSWWLLGTWKRLLQKARPLQ